MPSLREDDSIPTLVWRGRTNNGEFNLNAMKNQMIREGSLTQKKQIAGLIPTIVGLRDGVPDGAEQDIYYRQKLQSTPYIQAMHPFHSNRIEDLAPRHYEVNPMAGTAGELTNLASFGGTPLALALDEPNQLEQRIHTELFRMDAKNPLSATFAKQAEESNMNRKDVGSMNDVMRRQYQETQDEEKVQDQKLASGYYASVEGHDASVQAATNMMRKRKAASSQDVLDFRDLFKTSMINQTQDLQTELDNHFQSIRDQVSQGRDISKSRYLRNLKDNKEQIKGQQNLLQSQDNLLNAIVTGNTQLLDVLNKQPLFAEGKDDNVTIRGSGDVPSTPVDRSRPSDATTNLFTSPTVLNFSDQDYAQGFLGKYGFT